ncbi:MAG TPA: GspH/FimT family pseudopilin [Phycisphaerae bacterium]|nr:GspH/FimT family pseudopilin [Phycisphaerae bacterium]
MVGTPQARCRGGIAQAFSLIELVIVVSIIGVVAAIAAPRFANSIARQRAEGAAKRIAADLALARSQAITRSTSQMVKFDLGSDSYVMAGVQHLDRAASAYKVDLSAEPYLAGLVSADFGGDDEVVFDFHGTPDSGGQVVIKAGAWQKTVTLDPDTGKATVD